jgi:hypothetical protein
MAPFGPNPMTDLVPLFNSTQSTPIRDQDSLTMAGVAGNVRSTLIGRTEIPRIGGTAKGIRACSPLVEQA